VPFLLLEDLLDVMPLRWVSRGTDCGFEACLQSNCMRCGGQCEARCVTSSSAQIIEKLAEEEPSKAEAAEGEDAKMEEPPMNKKN
jgi:hypothetical protein